MGRFASRAKPLLQTGRTVIVEFLRFLKQPSLGATVPKSLVSKPLQLMWLLVLAFLATAVFAAAALPLILTGQSSAGGGLVQVVNQPLLPLILALVVLGPLVEEVIFRGWLTGTLKGGSFMLPLLMAAPLVICGWLFGYARIRLGIGSAWLLHALYNVPSAIGIAVMRSQG
jgi:membrane protease YdiL (CAAX protease family)